MLTFRITIFDVLEVQLYNNLDQGEMPDISGGDLWTIFSKYVTKREIMPTFRITIFWRAWGAAVYAAHNNLVQDEMPDISGGDYRKYFSNDSTKREIMLPFTITIFDVLDVKLYTLRMKILITAIC